MTHVPHIGREKVELIRTLRELGYGVVAISNQVGCSRETVRRWTVTADKLPKASKAFIDGKDPHTGGRGTPGYLAAVEWLSALQPGDSRVYYIHGDTRCGGTMAAAWDLSAKGLLSLHLRRNLVTYRVDYIAMRRAGP